ncbi:hypothetical protein [Streptomyces justiciae]|uniref:Secreted protein n=1 Tax=Streptomyces justiciae TaxID=2780140 RepID=A0ABU3LKA0_9ACTN|nr:hypothetical protein [Streptomyces justiciae]MDT7839670.1 hypothetical protein [Streptomyces justiciae]
MRALVEAATGFPVILCTTALIVVVGFWLLVGRGAAVDGAGRRALRRPVADVCCYDRCTDSSPTKPDPAAAQHVAGPPEPRITFARTAPCPSHKSRDSPIDTSEARRLIARLDEHESAENPAISAIIPWILVAHGHG